jgi:hypothetical protein
MNLRFALVASAILAATTIPSFASSFAQPHGTITSLPGYNAAEVIDNQFAYSGLDQLIPLPHHAIGKFGVDGVLDPSWGDGGIAQYGLRTSVPIPLADGKSLVVMADRVLRIDAHGKLDPTYGPAMGITGAPPPGQSWTIAPPWAFAPQADGSLVIAFHSGALSLPDLSGFVRITPNGDFDHVVGSFSTLPLSIDLQQYVVYAWSMSAGGDVEIAAYRRGMAMPGTTVVPEVWRFGKLISPSGERVSGRVLPHRGAANWISAHAKVDGFGRLLIAASGQAAQLWRFQADGTPDAVFNAQNTPVRLAGYQPWEQTLFFFTVPDDSQSVIDLWAAPGGRWLMPVKSAHLYSSSGLGSIGYTMPLRVYDDGGRLVSTYDQFIAGLDWDVSLVTRLDDGSFIYRSDTKLNLLKATAASPRVEATMIEYYNARLDHYFITLDGGESAILDTQGGDWKRTGYTFGAWMPLDVPGTLPVCRFYGDATGGPDSHFFTLQGPECDSVRALADRTPAGQYAWRLEGITFNAAPSQGGACPGSLVSIYRVYNRGFERGVAPNHRYTADLDVYQDMQAKGWAGEGVAFCMPPETSRRNDRGVVDQQGFRF